MEKRQELLRALPKIDELLLDEQLVFFMETTPRNVVVDAAREEIEAIRKEILNDSLTKVPERELIIRRISERVSGKKKKNLKTLLNATGVVLHTNLGRANLCPAAVESVRQVADSYSNLEYDIKNGMRGSRHDHVEQIIARITGAEAAMVVNNNAAATMICLSAMAFGKEVIVSRGELVEIGGSFRIPEIMEQSGAHLKEVGATNKTKPSDYRNAYDEERTGAFMKVHTSNYRILGFTQEVSLREMVELGKEYHLPVIYDMGSGLMCDLSYYGVDEPTVLDALKDGADVVLFSGDKLLGGPQGGVLIGKKEYIDRMKRHPLARAFRVDKMTIAAMEATFFEYLDMDSAKRTIPVLKMITEADETLQNRARKLGSLIVERAEAGLVKGPSCGGSFEETVEDSEAVCTLSIEPLKDQIGGGSAPTTLLDGWALTVTCEQYAAQKLERLLRKAKIPVIARISHDKLCFSVRTLRDHELSAVADSFLSALRAAGKEKGE